MQRSRRTVLASVPVALAGCAGSFRDNTVPGGLHLRNNRNVTVTVSVRAALLAERAGGGDGDGVTTSPTETPATPRDADLDDSDVTGEYEVAAGKERAVPDFFPDPGRWAFEAVVESADDERSDRTRLELYAALPGPTGADTVVVAVRRNRVTARATTVDD